MFEHHWFALIMGIGGKWDSKPAYCRFRSGETKAALSEFERLLDRWIANPKLQFGTLGIYTAEVATGELRDQLATRYDSLMQNNDWAWLDMTEQEGASE
jgi:hypothetical protein